MNTVAVVLAERAYRLLLGMPHGAERARLQPALATLRDTIAVARGKTPEEIQDSFEAKELQRRPRP